MAKSELPEIALSRRALLGGGLGMIGAAPIAAGAQAGGKAARNDAPAKDLRDLHPIAIEVNGKPCTAKVDVRTTLLDLLRDQLALAGSKKGCDHGQCGACTVHLDGQRVLSCLTLAVAIQGQRVVTIEGLAEADGSLHPMQQAFIDNDAFQCGYCTPGQIMSAVACIREGKAGSDAEIREAMSGNLCRCAAYPNIVAAVRQTALKLRS